MDAKVLDGCDLATELVREVRADAAEDRFFTNRANMDMAARAVCLATAGCKGYTLGTTTRGNHHKGACPLCGGFCF